MHVLRCPLSILLTFTCLTNTFQYNDHQGSYQHSRQFPFNHPLYNDWHPPYIPPNTPPHMPPYFPPHMKSPYAGNHRDYEHTEDDYEPFGGDHDDRPFGEHFDRPTQQDSFGSDPPKKASGYLKTRGIFSKDMIFGAATSAYQVEGAWNVDGKGESIWDDFTHRTPSPIRNNATGDRAADSYYRYKEDVRLAAELGLKLYRFSISWSRVLPTGYGDFINYKGLEYYKNLVREIRKYNMIPAATIYHFDLPKRLFDDGTHWTNPSVINHFVDFARIVIKHLPEVGFWFTINEPKQICHLGYNSDIFAPAIESDGLLEYQCSYIILKAHAAVYRMYKREFPHYEAKMTIVADCSWIEPFSSSAEDEEAAERQRQFECGLYYNPVFNGDWPEVVKRRIHDRSLAAGFSRSRLPQFTSEEIENIRGTADFLAVNHYYTQLARDVREAPPNETSYNADLGVADSFDPSWTVESNGIFVSVPFGVRKVLKWLTERYRPNEIMITEIGMSDNGTYTNDTDRVDFYGDYFCNILEAIDEGVNLIGIIYWSLLDNFEWPFGYTAHFGLYYIDFNDPLLRRRPKTSANFVRELSRTRKLNCDKPRRNWPVPTRLPAFPKDYPHLHGYSPRPHPRLNTQMVELKNRFYSDTGNYSVDISVSN